jgi:hypothetical protein
MYVLNEKGEKVKSNFFATDILSKIIQDVNRVVTEKEAKDAFNDLLLLNKIQAGNEEENWKTFKEAVCDEIQKLGSFHMSTCIVEGLCTVTKEGILYMPHAQIIVKYLLGKSIDWFCKT